MSSGSSERQVSAKRRFTFLSLCVSRHTTGIVRHSGGGVSRIAPIFERYAWPQTILVRIRLDCTKYLTKNFSERGGLFQPHHRTRGGASYKMNLCAHEHIENCSSRKIVRVLAVANFMPIVTHSRFFFSRRNPSACAVEARNFSAVT